MKIALDYGGVISCSPDAYGNVIKAAVAKGHILYVLSHAQPGVDLQLRKDYAGLYNMIDLSFTDLKSGIQEAEIAQRKADLCNQYEIDIFIDDSFNRVAVVAQKCPRTRAIHILPSSWEDGLIIIEAIV